MRKPLGLSSIGLRLLSSLCVLGAFVVNAHAANWIHWRGPEKNGYSPERDLPEKFSLDPKVTDNNLIWKQDYGCRSTPLVLKDRVYIINDTGLPGLNEQERVMCLDANTGAKIWEHKFNVWFTGIVSNRLGWTNLTADPETGNIYAHGTQGLLMCFDGKTGKVLWEHSLTEEFGRISGYGGRLASPICDGDLVIVGMLNAGWGDQSRGMNRYVAFDKKTGKVVWWTTFPGQIRGTYSSTPVIAVINGQRLLITGGGDGALHALQVRTGKEVWSYPFANVAIDVSPVVGPDGKVYISHGEESPGTNVQGRIICVDATKVKNGKPEFVWKVDGTKAGYTSPILHQDRLFVADNGARLHCFEAQKGKPLWRRPFAYGRLARGSGVWADGKIYIADVNSHFHILKPDDKKCEEVYDHYFASNDGKGFVEINGSPAIVNGRVYMATRNQIFCIGKKDHKGTPDKVTPLAPETPISKDAAPAVLQAVPADVVLAPGEAVDFTVRAFNANGQQLPSDTAKKIEWSFPTPPLPPGAKAAPPPLKATITPDGKLTVDKALPFQGAYLEGKAGMATARVRVRVISPLPLKVDFAKMKGGVPAGWVNCAARYVLIDQKDGSRVLKKIANKNAPPPLARANTFFGPPTWTNYTIQCDVSGKEVQGNRPDIGIVANRYTLLLGGAVDPKHGRRLHLMSWDALPRIDHAIPFEWKPDTWYRMKLTVDVQKDKAVVKGKVWPAAEKEPEKWTTTFTDPNPNREGAPALYGYAPGIVADTDVYYNNLSVTPNQKK